MEQSIHEWAGEIPLLKTLGIRLVEVAETSAVMEVTVGEPQTNYMGGAHGGLIATLIDTAAFFPKPLLPSGVKATTTALTVSYTRPAPLGETLTARSELVHLGKRTASVHVRVTNAAGKLVAHGTANLMFIDGE